MSDICLNAATPNSTSSSSNQPNRINIHLTLSAIVFAVNAPLLIHLLIHKVTSKKAQFIFQLQTVLDLLVGLVNLLNILQQLFCFYPMTGWLPFDVALCSWWHIGFMVWWLLVWSAHNLCFMAADRVLAVMIPLKYKLINKRWYYLALFCCFITSLATADPWAAANGVQDGECSSNLLYYELYKNPIYFQVITHSWSIMAFILPLLSIIVMYSLILWKLCAKRSESSTYSESTSRFTKTMLMVAAVFVVTQILPAVYAYIYEYLSSEVDSELDFWSHALAIINSGANPFIFFGEYLFRKILSRKKPEVNSGDKSNTRSTTDSSRGD